MILLFYPHGTGPCQQCRKPYDLANVSVEYKRDLNDWQWLCRRYHMLSDGRLHSRDQKTGKFIQRQELKQEIVASIHQT
jgi:hypothetical protein